MTATDAALLGALALCFIGAAGLGAAEVSVIRLRRATVLVDAESGSPRARRLLRLLDELPVVLNAILLLALGFQVTAATVAGVLADRWFGGVGVTVTTVALTAALFVYAEAVPKTRAMHDPVATALRLTPVVGVIVAVVRPIVTVLVWLAGLQTGGGIGAVRALSEAEIRAAAHESAEAGTIGRSDAELVARSFHFNDRLVAEVMVGRDDIVSVDGETSTADALALAIGSGHRRLPVRGADLDDIVGVVRLRDLAAVTSADVVAPVSSTADEILRAGPNDPISTLLTRMQRDDRWMAVVVDGDGRTVGIVTIEDVVAELVGDIEDERAAIRPADPGDRPPSSG